MLSGMGRPACANRTTRLIGIPSGPITFLIRHLFSFGVLLLAGTYELLEMVKKEKNHRAKVNFGVPIHHQSPREDARHLYYH